MPSLNDNHTTMFSSGNCVGVIVSKLVCILPEPQKICDSGTLQVQCRIDKAVYMYKCANLLVDINNSITAG